MEQRAAFTYAARSVKREQARRQGEGVGVQVDAGTVVDQRDGKPGAIDGRLAQQSAPILTTKLYVPRLRAGRVARPRLVER
ncbi:MAG TPA: hypothetical protein VLA19_18625, partial [Herpetosiphonaceae bacterium]|nr:hypothetical protein [Herpetosiphonaceae bacterium]